MRKLDRNREYYQVFGYSGVHHEQDGILFNAVGHPVVIRNGMAVPLSDKGEPEPEAVKEGPDLVELRQMAKIYDVEGYEDMTVDELQKALEGV